MGRAHYGRLLTGLAFLLGIVAAPVAAQAAPASIDVRVGDGGSVAPGYGYVETVDVRSTTAQWLEGPTITFELGGLAAYVTVKPSFGNTDCRADGTTVTCRPAGTLRLAAGWNPILDVTFKAAGNAPLGTTASIPVTVAAGNVVTGSDTFKLAVATTPVLTSNHLDDVTTTPGGEADLPITVTNNGSSVVHQATLVIKSDYPISSGSWHLPPECWHTGVYLGADTAYCSLNQDLQPGATYELIGPTRLRLGQDTLAPSKRSIHWTWLTSEQRTDPWSPGGQDPAPATLSLRKVARAAATSVADTDDTDATDNGGGITVSVEGDRGADFRVWGSLPTGRAGDVVEAHAIVRDLGPASAMLLSGGAPLYLVTIEVPPGTTVTKAAPGCAPTAGGKTDWARDGEPGAAGYQCRYMAPLRATDTAWHSFEIRIDEVIPNATGHVTLTWPNGRYPYDHNPTNETALIVVNQRAGGGSSSPTASPSTNSPTGGATGGSSDGTDGGGLPITGAAAGTLAGVGGAVILAGLVIFMIGRRRRLQFVADHPETPGAPSQR